MLLRTAVMQIVVSPHMLKHNLYYKIIKTKQFSQHGQIKPHNKTKLLEVKISGLCFLNQLYAEKSGIYNYKCHI